MRFTSVLKKLVGVTQLYVRGLVMDRDDDLSVEVRPTWRQARCAGCGRRAPQYDHPRSVGRWQDLNWGPVRIYLVYRCRRVTCARCGGRPCNELVPWAAAGTKCTHRMEELTAFLARQTDRTSVTRLLGIAWRTVGRIVRRVGVARLDPDRYTGLCQGRSKIRPRWRRKTRPSVSWAECLNAAGQAGGVRTPGRPRVGGQSCCVGADSCRRSAPGCGRDGSADRAARR